VAAGQLVKTIRHLSLSKQNHNTDGLLVPVCFHPIGQVAEAHAHLEAGHAKGKVVLKVADLP
jgi:hypothetical protein